MSDFYICYKTCSLQQLSGLYIAMINKVLEYSNLKNAEAVAPSYN